MIQLNCKCSKAMASFRLCACKDNTNTPNERYVRINLYRLNYFIKLGNLTQPLSFHHLPRPNPQFHIPSLPGSPAHQYDSAVKLQRRIRL
jgi:hypothetical protein